MPKDRQTIDNTSVQPESKVTFRGCIRSAQPEDLYKEGSRCEVLLRVENRHLLFDDQEGWQSILPDDEYYRVDATKMPKGDDRTIDEFLLTDIPGTKTFMNGNRVEFVGVDQGEADDWKADTEDGPWTMCGIVSAFFVKSDPSEKEDDAGSDRSDISDVLPETASTFFPVTDKSVKHIAG